MNKAQHAYDSTPIGAVGTMAAGEINLAVFQLEVTVLQNMASEGRIDITELHREKMSGHRYIDLVTFKRFH